MIYNVGYYLVEVTYLDDTKQKGLAALRKTNCTGNCWGAAGQLHNDWDIPKDSPIIDGVAKEVKPLRELKADTEVTDMTILDVFMKPPHLKDAAYV